MFQWRTPFRHSSPEPKIAEIPLFEWLFALVGMPVVYVLTGLLDRLTQPLGRPYVVPPSSASLTRNIHIVPKPVRLLLLALVIRWMVANLNLSLLTRQFWSGVASVITIAACVWLVLMLNAWGENLSRRRLERARRTWGRFCLAFDAADS